MAGRALRRQRQDETAREEVAEVEIAGREDIEGTPAALQELIRRRAHELYLEHGGRDRSEVDDWLQAETEILQSGRKQS